MNKKARRNMEALAARALLFQRKLAELPVEFSIPGISELDNQLSVLELGADQLSLAAKLAETPNGPDKMLATAASVCLSLVMRETKERIFSDTDVEAVSKFGMTVLLPLSKLVDQVSGLSPSAVEDAKKNSSTTPANDSNTSSPTASEATPSQS